MSVWVIGKTEDVRSQYKLGEQIGQPGQYGRAVLGKKLDPKPGEPTDVAIKIISKKRFLSHPRSQKVKAVMDSFRAEVEIMSKMRHNNIIRFYEAFEDAMDFYIVMEVASGGELFDRISARGQYTERDAAKVMKQLFEAINYMHTEMKVCHNDLKPDNCIFTDDSEDATLKLIDFGMAKLLKPAKYFSEFCGTPYYVAPEVLNGSYKESADVWSLGVVLFVLLHGYPPFHADQKKYGKNADDMIYAMILKGFDPVIKKGYKNHFPEKIPISAHARDLITKILVQDPAKRLTAEECLMHPWFAEAKDTPVAPEVVSGLVNFQRANRFQQGVLEVMANSLPQEEVDKLNKSFANMDKNGDGTITIDELRVALTEQKLSEDALQRVLKAADLDGDGTISYQELKLVTVARKLQAKEERLWEAFLKLDKNKDGNISLNELREVLKGQEVKHAEEILAQVDQNGDGVVDYDEFLAMWRKEEGPGSDDAAALDAAAPPPAAAAAADPKPKPKKKSGGFLCCGSSDDVEDNRA